MKASHPWTQLSWSNEHKVLSRTLSTLVSEVAQFYVSSSTGAASAGEGGESFVAVSKEFERKRFASLAATRKALSGFKNDLKLIKSKQQHSAGNVDPVLIKELLENFESKLTAYKSAMRRDFDALVSDLGPTEEEVRLCLERSSVAGVDGDDSHDGGAAADQQQQAKREKAKQDLDKNLQMQTQVGLLDRQIQELGGRYGHWDPRDHDVFMRVWNQTPHAPNQPEGQQASSSYPPKKRLLCRKLVTLLSDKTDVECEEHFDWYVQYTALLERKKKLLGEWKGTTQSERERERRAILAGQIAAEGGPGDSETSRDGSNSNSHSHSHAQSGRSGQSGHSEAEAQRMRQQVERWKQSRADEQAARAQEEREQELREQQLRQERARKRQQEARLQLDKWKADEAVIKQLEALELSGGGGGGGGGGGSGSPRRRTSVSTADIESNAARDLEIAKRRREEREAKEKKASLRETRLKDLEGRIGSAPSAPRDPARLLADTVTTGLGRKTAEQLDLAERRRASSGAHSSAMALSARDLTHGGMRRAMPVWTRPGV